MAKLTLSDVTSLTNESSATGTINQNSDAIETAMENTLSLDGTTPNSMNAPLDMNSNQIINLPPPSTNQSPIRVSDLATIVDGGTISVPANAFGLPYSQGATGAITSNVGAKLQERVSILDFGAVPDNTTAHATANYNAFVNALATNKTVVVPYSPLGYNIGANSISLTSGQAVIGEDRKTNIFGTGTSIFNVSSTGPTVTISNLTLYGANGAGTTGILLNTSAAGVNRVYIGHMDFLYLTHGISDQGTNPCAYITIEDTYHTETYGVAIRLQYSNGAIRLKDNSIDFTLSSGLISWGAMNISNFAGVELSGWNFASGGSSGNTYASTAAFTFSNGAVLNIDGNLYADGTFGDGVSINTVQYIWGRSIEGSQNLGNQVILTSCSYFDITTVIANGAVGISNAASGGYGLTLNGCSYGSIGGIFARKNTGNGISIPNTTYCLFSNIQAGQNTSYGLIESGTSNYNLYQNCVFNSNATDIAITGAQSRITNYVTSNIATIGNLSTGTGLPISTGVSGLGTGVATFLGSPSSANLASALTDETGSGSAVFANTPTLVTPVLGAATGTSLSFSLGGYFYNATSTTAGGAGPVVKMGSSGLGLYWGSGLPTISAPQGSLYLRSDGSSSSTRLYVNSNGTTGWVNVTTAS